MMRADSLFIARRIVVVLGHECGHQCFIVVFFLFSLHKHDFCMYDAPELLVHLAVSYTNTRNGAFSLHTWHSHLSGAECIREIYHPI